MKFRTLIGISLLLGTTSGCGGVSNTAPTNAQTPAPSASASSQPSAVRTVTIESPDKTVIVGSLYESGKANSPGLLLLHQWQSDRHSYDEFAQALQARGFTVLAIDGRGFGESMKTADGRAVAPDRSDAAVKAMLQDVGASLDFLAKQKNVDSAKIGIVGASYGSSLALIYAADHSDVAAVALLSPGLNYFGNMPTETAVAKLKDRRKPNIIFLAAEDDKGSADAVRKLDPVDVDNYFFPRQIFKTGGHGTALLKVGADRSISDFFADRFDLANLHVRP